MNGIILFAGFIFVLWLGRAILIPLLVATFLWYLINAISAYCRKVFPLRDVDARRTYPISAGAFDWLSNIIALCAMAGLLYLFASQVRPMFSELLVALPAIQHKLVEIGITLSGTLGIRFDASLLPNVTRIASSIGTSLAGIATSVGLICIYLLFMFVEQTTFDKKFSALFPNKMQFKKMLH